MAGSPEPQRISLRLPQCRKSGGRPDSEREAFTRACRFSGFGPLPRKLIEIIDVAKTVRIC